VGWLAAIRAIPPGNSGAVGLPQTYVDPETHFVYASVYAVQGVTQSFDGSQTLMGYVGAPIGAKPGDMASTYDVDGVKTGEFKIVDTAKDPFGMVALLLIAAMTAGAALYGVGILGAAGGAGASSVGAAAGGAVELGTVTGADLGAFYGGLDAGATLGGGASVAGGSALGTAVSSSVTAASSVVKTIGSSLLSTAGSVATSVLGAAGTAAVTRAFGIGPAGAATPPGGQGGGYPVAGAPPAAGTDWPTYLLIGGALAGVAFVIVKSKG
jgi:hypothetical protein